MGPRLTEHCVEGGDGFALTSGVSWRDLRRTRDSMFKGQSMSRSLPLPIFFASAPFCGCRSRTSP